jgi:hypothetical protein
MDIGTHWSATAIPLLILIARIAEASLESVRTISISKGHANLAAYVGIVKTCIWLISTSLVLTNLTQYWNLFAYLAGYGIGTVLGMAIENFISIGYVIVRLIHPRRPAAHHVPAFHAGIWHDPDRRHRKFLRIRQHYPLDCPKKGTLPASLHYIEGISRYSLYH